MSAGGGNEAAARKPNEPSFFYEDEVFRFHRGSLQVSMFKTFFLRHSCSGQKR
jgi:hypothetical protein